MSDEDDTRSLERRTVVEAIAGLGVAGLATQPVSAASDDHPTVDEKFLYGPLADVPEGEKYTYAEFERLLRTEDNGSVELVRGDVRSKRAYLGDNRTVSASEARERFEYGTMADTGTWNLGCLDAPNWMPIDEVCTKITLNAYFWGIEFDLTVLGYPVVGAGIGYKDGLATFKFNVPKLPIKGELTVGAEQLGGCDATLTADLSFKYVPGSLSGSQDIQYC